MFIVTAETMRRCEAANFEQKTATPESLMAVAGAGCAEHFRDFFTALPEAYRRRVVICAGHGNNGGDGLVMAGMLGEMLGVPIEVQLAMPPEKMTATARIFFDRLPREVVVRHLPAPELNRGDVVIDALLGTGVRPPLREPYRRWIETINTARRPVFALDLPSGTGTETPVRASRTAAIGYFKDTLFTEAGIASAGTLRKVALPLTVLPENEAGAPLAVDAEWVAETVPPLAADAHKYQRGNVLIAGGSEQYMHAPFLSARACLRAGAGLVRLAVPRGVSDSGSAPLALIVTCLADGSPYFDCAAAARLPELTAGITVVAAGPGWGRHRETADFLAALLKLDLPLVLDADALFFASTMRAALRARSAVTVLTPHAGEARTLAAGAGMELPGARLPAARMLANAYRAIVVLKGARTVIAAPDDLPVYLNTSGTAALATAGSGDCLTGAIAAELAARGATTDPDAQIAAARAVFLHGLAGEWAETVFGRRGVIADDLPDAFARVRRSVEHEF